jgi:hypothetical protein
MWRLDPDLPQKVDGFQVEEVALLALSQRQPLARILVV